MKITFVRKKAFPLFFSTVPVMVDGKEVVKIKNGGTFEYEGPATAISLHGPGVVRNVSFDLETPHQELTIELKIAMGLFAGGFKVRILNNGEVVQKLRKTY